MQGRHHLQHCAARFFVPLKKLGVCSAQFLTEPLGTNSGAFRFAKLHCSSDARLRRLSFGKYLSPGSTDILRENSLRRRPPRATFRFIAYQAYILYQIFPQIATVFWCCICRFFKIFHLLFCSIYTKKRRFFKKRSLGTVLFDCLTVFDCAVSQSNYNTQPCVSYLLETGKSEGSLHPSGQKVERRKLSHQECRNICKSSQPVHIYGI